MGETLKVGCYRPGTGKFRVGGICGDMGCAYFFLLPLWPPLCYYFRGGGESLFGPVHSPLGLRHLNGNSAANLGASGLPLWGLLGQCSLLEKSSFSGILE